MNTNCKKLLIIPLLLAVAVAPVCAQDNGAPPPSAPTPPPAITSAEATVQTTNESVTPPKHHKDSSEHTPVLIDSTGIHVGGADPVDINIPGMEGKGMPHFHGAMAMGPFGSDGGIPPGAVLISVIAIVTPFAFLAFVVVGIVIFKHRRNRMLHDTLRAMIDKGVPIPPELIVPPAARVTRRAASDLRAGLVILGIGLSVVIFLGKLGWIAVFVGVAFLITWLVEKKDSSKNNEQLIKP